MQQIVGQQTMTRAENWFQLLLMQRSRHDTIHLCAGNISGKSAHQLDKRCIIMPFMLYMQSGRPLGEERHGCLTTSESAESAGNAAVGETQTAQLTSFDAAISRILKEKICWFEQKISNTIDAALSRMDQELTQILQKKLSMSKSTLERCNGES